MASFKYRKEVTLDHKYFKNQTHYINYYKKVMSTHDHELLTEANIRLFAWILVNNN